MTAKQLFAALGIGLAILSFVPFFHEAAYAFVAGGVISVGVSILVP